jgi:hypothetical protein
MRSDIVPGGIFPDYAPGRVIRPDWGLSAPGLREAWAAGDYSYFHGWDRKSGKAPVGL